MAECFCGCGRDIGGFGMRGMNKQGRRTVGLVAKLGQAREVLDAGGPIKKPKQALTIAIAAGDRDVEDFEEVKARTGEDENPFVLLIAEVVDGLIEQGEEFNGFWQDVVHDVSTPPPSEASRIKKDWQKWGREGMGLCSAIGVRISRRGAFSGEV